MYLYESHLGGLYITEDIRSYDELYCETCGDSDWGWKCSYCGYVLPDDFDDPERMPAYRYCMNCGAKMFSSYFI